MRQIRKVQLNHSTERSAEKYPAENSGIIQKNTPNIGFSGQIPPKILVTNDLKHKYSNI